MVVLVFLLLIAAIVIIATVQGTRRSLGDMMGILLRFSDEMSALRKQVADLKDELRDSGGVKEAATSNEHASTVKDKDARGEEDRPTTIMADPTGALTEVAESGEGEQGNEQQHEVYSQLETEVTVPAAETIPTDGDAERTGYQQPPATKSTDLERFIGENLINKIGIAILILGISFFVKYAIDKEWINEAGRVSIGMLCGAALVGIAHYLRKEYRSFSSVLAGGGIAVFYFTTAFAYHAYHLFPQQVAFVLMVAITSFTVFLSVRYSRVELAVIAAVGGFITPFLVSNGEGNYVALFIYLLVLDAGLLALAWYRRWPLLNIISLGFTQLIYGGWLASTSVTHKQYNTSLALIFAALFYTTFLAMNMIYQIRNSKFFRSLDLYLLLLTSAGFYASGMFLLHNWHDGDYCGSFTLAVGVINMALAFYVRKLALKDKNLFYLLTGLTLTFVTLAISVQLHGSTITLFWLAEMVLLYWLFLRSGMQLFKISTLLVCALASASLLLGWSSGFQPMPNAGFTLFADMQGAITSIFASLAFFALFMLLKSRDEDFLPGLANHTVGRQALWAAIVILYFTTISLINLQLPMPRAAGLQVSCHVVATGIFALAIIQFFPRRQSDTPGFSIYIIGPAIVLVLHYFIASAQSGRMVSAVLHGRGGYGLLLIHWFAVALVIAAMTIMLKKTEVAALQGNSSSDTLLVLTTLAAIAILSIELRQVYILVGYDGHNIGTLKRSYSKAGLSAIWGLSSFVVIWIGMSKDRKALRVLSLLLFLVVLLKLFAFDISGISEGGKIFAFVLLGIILLVVSFMYQRLKKIIFDDQSAEK